MKTDDVIALITSSDLNIDTRKVIVANYFDIICSADTFCNIIQNTKTPHEIASELINRMSLPQFIGCNNEFEETLIKILDNKIKYDSSVVDCAIRGLASHDNLHIMNNHINKTNIMYYHENYGALIEYLVIVTSNNISRVNKLLYKLLDTKYDIIENDLFVGNIVLDILYMHSNRMLVNASDECISIVKSLGMSNNIFDIEQALTFEETTFKNCSICFFDYNSVLETLHYRYGTRFNWKGGDASVKKENFEIFNFVLDYVAPLLVHINDNDDYNALEVARLLSVDCGYFYAIPCSSGGNAKGILLIHSNQVIPYEILIEGILVSKYIGKTIKKIEAELLAVRYYDDFVRQHNYVVRSFNHEVAVAFGNLRAELGKIQSIDRLQDDIDISIGRCIDSCQIMDDAIQLMTKYSDVNKELCPINDILDLVIRAMDVQIRESKVNIYKYYSRANAQIMKVPGTYIIFQHLITNAIESVMRKKTDDKNVKIFTDYNNDTNTVKVTIEDDGVGIPKSFKNKIFMENVSSKGSGIGLSIVTVLVKDMGGKIYFDDVDEGAVFVVEIPGGN